MLISGSPEQQINKTYDFKRKAEYIILLVVFRILLDYSYNHIVSTVYGYMGFKSSPNNTLFIISWLMLVVAAIISFKAYVNEEGKESNEIIFSLILMSFVPFTSMVRFGAVNTQFIIWNTVYWSCLLFCILNSKIKIKKRHSRITVGNTQLVGDSQLIGLAIIFGIVVLYISGRYAHFRLNFDLLGVYELRAEAKANSLPTILLYLFTWSRALNSILVAYFIRRKRIGWAVFCIVIQLLSFGYDGSKSTFFLLLIAIGVNLLPRFSMKELNKWVLRGFVIIIGICALFYIIGGNILPASIVTRRVFFLPIRISKDYFEFFTTHQPDYFRQSFLRYFGASSPYPSIANMIGGIYFNSDSMSANNGLISDAIANLGYVGIFIFPILISVVLKWMDRSSKGLDPRIFVTVALYIGLALSNSFLFTVLLTHGLLVTIVMLGMMERQNDILE